MSALGPLPPREQFPSDEEAEVELDISDDALAAKNEKCGGRLARSFRGPAHEVFAKVLRGLSGTKLTKPGTFRDAEGTGFAVRCSYKVRGGWGPRGSGVGVACCRCCGMAARPTCRCT